MIQPNHTPCMNPADLHIAYRPMRRNASVLLVSLVVAGCAMHSPELDPAPRILERWSGVHGGSASESTLVVRDVPEWRNLWRQVGQEPPREFDATSQIAVAIFIGERNTGGYSVEIDGFYLQGRTLRIEYREKMPQPGRMVAQVITSPWIIALVSPPCSSERVEFARLNSRNRQREQ